MTRVPRLPALFPPFVVGATLAVAMEVGAGLLLYSGLGFLQALSAILATQMAALAIGLWSVEGVREAHVVEALRRRWLLLLLAFSAAAFFAGGWEILGGLSADPTTQALGMALLAGLPLFAGGAILGLLLRGDAGVAFPRGGALPGPAAAAALGAGVGFLGTGFFILRNLTPTSILLGCVILVSAAALVHGRVLTLRARAAAAQRSPGSGAGSEPQAVVGPRDAAAKKSGASEGPPAEEREGGAPAGSG